MGMLTVELLTLTCWIVTPNAYNVRGMEVTVLGIPSGVIKTGHISRPQIGRLSSFSQELGEQQRRDGDAR